MITSEHDLVEALRARGMATGERASAGDVSPVSDRPWYIGLLLGTAGWFAGIFGLIFVFMLFKPDSAGSALVVGVVLLGAAWGMFMADREGAFVSQLALALSIAGQFAALFGFHELFFKGHESVAGLAAIAIVLQVVLVLVMPSRLHRAMSTLFACVAWALAVRYAMSTPSIGTLLVFFAIVWLPVGGALYALIRTEPAWIAAGRQGLMRPVTLGLIAALAVATLISYPIDSFDWSSSTHARDSWLALWPLLSALAALGALAGAFALGNRGLMGICVVAALLHISHFYYTMGTSLMIKSLTMLALGAVLLGVAHALKREGQR